MPKGRSSLLQRQLRAKINPQVQDNHGPQMPHGVPQMPGQPLSQVKNCADSAFKTLNLEPFFIVAFMHE
jgi:hypothetical protein